MSAAANNLGSQNMPEAAAPESGTASWASTLKASGVQKTQPEPTTDYFEMTD